MSLPLRETKGTSKQDNVNSGEHLSDCRSEIEPGGLN